MPVLTDGITYEILKRAETHLIQVLMTDIDLSDPARPGYVGIGETQGEPGDPDELRIQITLHENDPDDFEERDPRGIEWYSHDETDFSQEVGPVWTMIRRFTIKIRSLFDSTQEDRETARKYNSRVVDRIVTEIRRVDLSNINVDGEYVSLPFYRIEKEIGQFGGPDSYDFYSKVRWSLKTTQVLTG